MHTSPTRPRVAFLGPAGTFSEDAALEHFGAEAVFLTCSSIPEVVEQLVGGRADGAVVPLDNTIVGVIPETAKSLETCGRLVEISAHVRLPVRHQLVAAPGGHLDDIEVLTSHRHALTQCGQFIQKHLTTVTIEEAPSTAAGVLRARGTRHVAAIASARAASLHGVIIVAADIQDPGENVTTFAVLQRALPGRDFVRPVSLSHP